MGATSPGRWQLWQFFCSIGNTSRLKLGLAAAASPVQVKPAINRRIVPPLRPTSLDLLPKSEQDIAGQSLPHPIAGVGVYHSASNYGTGGIQRAALSGYAIDGFVIAYGIEVPDDLAGLRQESPEVPVHRPRKY